MAFKLLKKVFFIFLLLVIIVVALGMTGASFCMWPTFFDDRNLNVSDAVKSDISKLIEERKFDPVPSEFYFSIGDEAVRVEAEMQVNLAIQEIVKVIQNNPKKSAVLFSIKNSLSRFNKFDSEEKDRVLFYFEKVLDILEIESSNELFNVWRYGFPYGWFIKNV